MKDLNGLSLLIFHLSGFCESSKRVQHLTNARIDTCTQPAVCTLSLLHSCLPPALSFPCRSGHLFPSYCSAAIPTDRVLVNNLLSFISNEGTEKSRLNWFLGFFQLKIYTKGWEVYMYMNTCVRFSGYLCVSGDDTHTHMLYIHTHMHSPWYILYIV